MSGTLIFLLKILSNSLPAQINRKTICNYSGRAKNCHFFSTSLRGVNNTKINPKGLRTPGLLTSNYMFLNSIKRFLPALFICCLLPIPAFARDSAVIKDVVVMTSESELLLYFQVANAFTDEMRNGVKNGIPVSFTFYMELLETREGGPDKDIVRQSFDHTLTYDNLKEEFLVEFGETDRIVTAASQIEADRIMAEVHDYKLETITDLHNGGTYKLRIKARLAKKKLPFNFQYVIPFWNLWEFETEWLEIKFVLELTQK